MWRIRNTEEGYYPNVVEYRVKISIQPTVDKSLNSTNIFVSYCLKYRYVMRFSTFKNGFASKPQTFD